MEANVYTPAEVWMLIVENPLSAGVFLALLVSEALASIKAVQANSIFQLVYGLLKKVQPEIPVKKEN